MVGKANETEGRMQSKPKRINKKENRPPKISIASRPGTNEGPIHFTKIKKTGLINVPLFVTVDKITSVQNGFKFLFSKATSRIQGLAFHPYAADIRNRLEVGHSYIIKGVIKAETRNLKYISQATSRLDLYLYKIEIQKNQTAEEFPCSKRKRNKLNSGVLSAQRKFAKAIKFVQDLKDVVIETGKLYRYWGCSTCLKKVEYHEGKSFCPKEGCPYKSDEETRKTCLLIRGVRLKDWKGNVLENVVFFNAVCEQLLKKTGDDFDHDNHARNVFEAFLKTKAQIDIELSGAGVVRGNSNNYYSGNPIQLVAKSIVFKKVEPRTYDETGDGFHSRYASTSTANGYSIVPDIDAAFHDLQLPLTLGQGSATRTSRNISEIQQYKLASKPPGLFLAINNKYFPQNPSITTRNGSEMDVKNLTNLFQKFDFKTFEQHEVKSTDLGKIIDNFKTALVQLNVDSSIIFLGSHGDQQGIELVDGEMCDLYGDIIHKFSDENFPAFRGKPKIFIIQACQYFKSSQRGVNQPDQVHISDTLLCLPSMPGYAAYRSGGGSRFINELVQVFTDKASTMNINQMLRLVQFKMGEVSRKENLSIQLNTVIPFLFEDFCFKTPAPN